MSSFNGQPYLSVVVTARNDDHGGNLRARMQTFVNGLISQCRRHRVAAELIMIEWNPPPDRPRLAEALDWPADDGWCPVRIIEVGAELHQRWASWQALPLFQMIGKNAGIRRARGEFVLATNVDVLFSDELMSFLGERRLDPHRMYRLDRWDVMPDVPVDAPVEEQLEYCRTHLIRLNAREGTFRVGNDGLRLLEDEDILAQDAAMRLGRGWFQREMSGEEPFRWVENDAELILNASAERRTLVLDVEPGPGVGMGPFLLELRDGSDNKISEVWVRRRTVVTFALPGFKETACVRLHTRHGGDRIDSDMRVLNFRVLGCGIETGSGSSAGKETAAKVRTAAGWRSRVGRGLKMVREIWRGNPNVQIRLPMSRERLARLELRQDGSGISFSAQALKAQLAGGGIAGDLLPAGMGARWGPGWLPREYFAGETFRWMDRHAKIVWIPPRDAPSAFELEVEPGPAVGFQACELEIRNQWDEVMARHPVKGRTRVRIPTAGGPLVSSLALVGGGPPRKVPGDPRSLVLRFLGCKWARGGEGTGSDDQVWLASREPMAAGAGIWCCAGWESVGDSDERRLGATPGAELLLRAPGANRRVLTLEVAPISGSGKAADLVVEDPFGRVLFRGTIDSPQRVRLEGCFVGGNDYALRLVEGAHASGTEEPWLILSAIEWGSAPGETPEPADPVWIAVRASRPDHPVALHTNACGDFTLLARDRWMDLRGYAEMDVYALNLDSLLCWCAHHGGAREQELKDPMRVYHIEHGAGWTPEGEQKLFDRLTTKGVSWVDYREILGWARVMHRFDSPMIFNLEDWGLAKEELQETIPRSTAEGA
jgi:hypothetical protein